MKTLSLKNLNLSSNDLLQREQLKNVYGGYGGGCISLGDICIPGGSPYNDPCCSNSRCKEIGSNIGICSDRYWF